MIIIPAIDLLDGQVVRLKQGNYNSKTVYANNPVMVAKKFALQGAAFLHIVDLDGARTGKMQNLQYIFAIQKSVKIPLQVGGGVRSIETVDYLLKNGIDRVVLGTQAIINNEFLSRALEQFGSEKIAVSLDVKDGMPMVNGWMRPLSSRGAKRRSNLLNKAQENSLPALALAKFKRAGLSYFIYTDIVRDGMKSGPNFDALKKIRGYGFKLIASGGVSCAADVGRLKRMGVYGCIVGRAAYEDEKFLQQCLPNE